MEFFSQIFRLAFANTKVDARPIKQNRPTENAHNQMFTPPEIVAAAPVILSSVDKTTKNELETILRRPAITSEEK